MKKLKNLLNKIRTKKALQQAQEKEASYVVQCPKCLKFFNAFRQAGICPHLSIGEFIYRIEKDDKKEDILRVPDFAETDQAIL